MGHGHALWLLPEARAFARLSNLIAEIAQAEGAPRFEPHVTLLSRIGLEVEDVVERSRTFAAVVTPIDVLLARAAPRPDFFEALFLEVEGGDLPGIRVRAAAAMGITPEAEYRPHLSLLYADRPAAAKDAMLDRIGRDWNEPCLLDRLAVVRPEGPAESWARAATFSLGGP
jgi:hypothetical protein